METKKEFIKVIGASLLCIGVFIAAFSGISNLALASAIGGTISIPADIAEAYLPNENALPEGYQPPTLTVGGQDWSNPDVNAMSREEAAEIGALYIWEIFGESIDGKYVRMLSYSVPSQSRAYWHGIVHHEEFTLPFGLHSFVGVEITEEMVNEMRDIGNYSAPPEIFRFAIDAVTGERISISRNFDYNSGDRALLDELRQDEDARMIMGNFYRTVQPPDDITEYAQVAIDAAQRHFTNTQTVSVEFENAQPAPAGFGRDSDGNIFVKYRDIMFLVTDSTGREAYVIVHEADGVTNISTEHNDIMPGLFR